jgi:hypothetical protein
MENKYLLVVALALSTTISFGQRIPAPSTGGSHGGNGSVFEEIAGQAVKVIFNSRVQIPTIPAPHSGTPAPAPQSRTQTSSPAKVYTSRQVKAEDSSQIEVENVYVNTVQNNTNIRKIQVALLLDVSGSMDSMLLDVQAKISSLVNDLKNLKDGGRGTSIEFALYEYGMNDRKSENHIHLIVPFTTNSDLLAQTVSKATISGGYEFCGAVIAKSLSELEWSSNANDLKMIYVIGNEFFNQGNKDLYVKACEAAVRNDITVNTIYCGDKETGIKELWSHAATIGHGEYLCFSGSVKKFTPSISPYDEKLLSLNTALNKTYFGLGVKGENKKFYQLIEDQTALSNSTAALVERTIEKAKAGNNNSWDLIDAKKMGLIDFKVILDEDLPKEFQGKTPHQKDQYLENKGIEREAIQLEILKLASDRTSYFASEKLKFENSIMDMKNIINQSVTAKASTMGFMKEVPSAGVSQ